MKDFIKKYRSWLAAAAVLLLLVAAVLIFRQLGTPEETLDSVNETEITTPTLLRGVALSPRSYEGSDFTDFLDRANEAGEIISWAGHWRELANEGSAPHVLGRLAAGHDYQPLWVASHPGSIDEQTVATYVTTVSNFAAEYQPDYFGLGNELNLVARENPSVYEAFRPIFVEARAAIKEVSPDTVVFTTWQLEQMQGLRGGLFGGVNDPDQHQWGLLNDFPDADLYAFTTYPGIIYRAPADIPADYYQVIGERTTKPVAISEVGWASAPTVAGWGSDEREQASFLELFFERMEVLNPEFMIWPFLFDQDIEQPFTSMGLIAQDGSPKRAWPVWADYIASSRN